MVTEIPLLKCVLCAYNIKPNNFEWPLKNKINIKRVISTLVGNNNIETTFFQMGRAPGASIDSSKGFVRKADVAPTKRNAKTARMDDRHRRSNIKVNIALPSKKMFVYLPL